MWTTPIFSRIFLTCLDVGTLDVFHGLPGLLTLLSSQVQSFKKEEKLVIWPLLKMFLSL